MEKKCNKLFIFVNLIEKMIWEKNFIRLIIETASKASGFKSYQ